GAFPSALVLFVRNPHNLRQALETPQGLGLKGIMKSLLLKANVSEPVVHHSRQKNKSKKRRHPVASVSYSDSDWRSGSSPSISSSSSDESYRARRMTRPRDYTKRNSKRSRRSSSSSSEGRVSVPRHHKRKGESKWSTKLDKRKKPIKKKRKNACSPGSDSSKSCSTCRDLNSSGIEDSEIERSRRSVVRKVNIRGRSHHKENSRKRKYHSRSRSSSSCSGCSRGSHGRDNVRLVEKSFPRRLESVITIFRDSENGQGKDEDKADIIPAHDDCPSRSNDSYEGAAKRDNEPQHFDHSGQYALEKVRPENEGMKYKDGVAGAQPGQRDCPFSEKNNCVSETPDLEHLLRQKALENFKRFRDGLACSKPCGVENGGDGVLRESTVESSQTRDKKSGMASLDGRLTVDLGNHGCIRSRHVSESKTVVNPLPVGSHNSAEDINFIGVNSKTIESSLTLRSDSVCNKSIHRQMHSGKPEKAANDAINVATTACLNENQHSRNGELALNESSNKQSEQLSGIKDVLLEKVAGISSTTATPRSMQGMGVKKSDASGSLLSPHHESKVTDHASTETLAEEVKDGSQYEQKTMSVMRGGEMVQVSYKVYIPKKPPALARRQLRR
ncbi:hypothetical protein ACLOJK_039352, partial [Asimina triloba]